MLVAPGLDRHAVWYRARQPVRGESSARQFGHADRHADAAEAVWQSGDGGGDDLCMGMGVAAHLMLAAVNPAAQRRALHEDVFEVEAKAFLDRILWRGQFQLGLLDPEGPFQCRLHAHRTFCASAAIGDRFLQGHRTPRIRRCSGVTSPRSNINPHMAALIMLAGRYSSELTFAA